MARNLLSNMSGASKWLLVRKIESLEAEFRTTSAHVEEARKHMDSFIKLLQTLCRESIVAGEKLDPVNLLEILDGYKPKS